MIMPPWRSFHKIPIVGGLGIFQVGEHIHTGKVMCPNSTGQKALVLVTLPEVSQVKSSVRAKKDSWGRNTIV